MAQGQQGAIVGGSSVQGAAEANSALVTQARPMSSGVGSAIQAGSQPAPVAVGGTGARHDTAINGGGKVPQGAPASAQELADSPARTARQPGAAMPQSAAAAPADTPPSPQVAGIIGSVFQSFDQNDPKQAQVLIEEALKQYPNEPHLEAVAKLIEPKNIRAEPKLAQKIKSLLFNPPAQEEAARAGARPQLASPIGGLLTAAAARPGTATALPQSVPLELRQSLPQKTMLDMKMGDYSAAESDLSQQLKNDPSNYVAWRLRGLTRYYEQNLPGAESDADRALALNEKDSPSHWVKALVKLDSADPEGAKEEADASIALDPKNADALVTRAEALEKLGRADEALDDFRAAAQLDPEDFKQLYHRAVLRHGMSTDLTQLSRARALYLAAAGLALLFLGLSFLVKRRQTTIAKAAMRSEDHHPALGGFRILRRVGQGGMGVVFEAVDEALERRVALKRMRDEVAGDPRERKRFIKEARTVAALRHPAIVEIYSIVEQDQALYLVFEFLHGQTLDGRLGEGGGRLSPSEALPLAKDIAEALDYAHSRGVVHQDLKPGNVVVDGGHAKVMDFGIARRVQETLSTISRMEVAGTPAYMAPEQERGTVSPAADVYAFGACLYEMLSGRRPFSMGGYMEKAQRQYPPLSKLAGLPASVDRVIDRALDPDPLRRPASAKDLVAALEAALALPRA